MGLIDRIRGMRRKEKIVLASVVAFIVVAVVAVVLLLMRNNYLATTMRLLRVEGTVNIEDSNGTTKPVMDNIRFESGDALSTGSDGLASVGLDDTKIVTLESDSRVEFNKQGKQLELELTQGGLFFEVTEKLADDEKYEIKTSNMTVGIRGTSGYVYYSESGLQSLIITDGVVKVTGYNPTTKETKTVEVHGGEKVSAYLYDESTDERDSIEFEVTEVPEEELPAFPLKMLAENPDLLDKVCKETGWNKEELLSLVNALTDPNAATPTPDAIITITDTPTPTAKPTNTPLLTPTLTDTPTPSPTASPKPTKNPTGTPSPVPTVAPSATPTATAAPSSVPTVTATPTATVVPTVVPTVTPSATPTAKPTSAPTVTPTAIPTVPTVTPSATPSVTPSATPTEDPTPPPTPTEEPTPEPPEEYSDWTKLSSWGETYGDHKVYILTQNNENYVGYYDGDWVALVKEYTDTGVDYVMFDGDAGTVYYHDLSNLIIDPSYLWNN